MAMISSPVSAVHEMAGGSKGYRPALFSLAVLYFMMGFITCLNDSLVPFFKTGFHLSYSESSLVQFYFFLTYAIVSIPAGKLVGRIGYKNGMVAGFLIAAFGALLFLPASMFHLYELFLAALFILAIGIVLLQVSANPYIAVLGPVETASSRLTFIQGMGSIGTTVAPLFGARFILSTLEHSPGSSGALRLPYLGIGAGLLLIALVLLKLRLPVIKAAGSEAQQSNGATRPSLFSFRNLNFGAVGIFMYVGAEVAIGTFLTSYIADRVHISNDVANRFVAFYWGGMLAGRLIGSLLLRTIRPPVLLVILSIASIILITTSILTDDYLSVWTMIAVGVCNSVMFAIIFSLSISGLASHTTAASGVLSTAIVGGAIISFAVGYLKDHFSWELAYLVPVCCYLYLLFFGINGYKSRYSPMK